MLFVSAAGAAAEAGRSAVQIGESIYRFGILGSGQPLVAVREGGAPGATGAAGACVNCHQRSGLGSAHQATGGTGARIPASQIPPVAWRYLVERVLDSHDQPVLPYVDGMRADRSAYTPETFARAVREGIDPDGRPLGILMPRFALSDDDLAGLMAYLKTLDPTQAPGVAGTTVHFATIITPDVDPDRKRAMLAVMEQFFAERNVRQMAPSALMHATGRTQYARSMFMVHRQWKLHVWSLSGPPSDWGRQLEADFKKEPVLAVISGLGRGTWAPVHDFCERQQVACLFPNVDVPVDQPASFFELNLSRGVLLEADLISDAIAPPSPPAEGARPKPVRVHQVYRAGDSGEAASRELAARLSARGIRVTSTALPAEGKGAAGATGGKDVARAVAAAAGADALVLWLRSSDLSALPDAGPVPAAVYGSGLMGGLEHAALPPSWRPRVHLAYPFDLPEKRTVRVDFATGWFRMRKIPVVDLQMQADTYLVCGLVSEAMKEVMGTYYSPYLIEELQQMVEHRVLTGYYPRLSLAENQHFASKGGYLVHFDGAQGDHISADGEWAVP